MNSSAQLVPQQRGLTIRQAAAWLGTNDKQIRRLIHHRQLSAVRLGKAWIVDRLDLEAWWQKAKQRGA